MIAIVRAPIDILETIHSVMDPAAGALDVFIGTTRDHSNNKEVQSLSYEAYDPMALNMLQALAEEVKKRWRLKGFAIVHRIGSVAVGEASVVIAVSSPHRKEAFDACHYAIDYVKKNVPIWKKEIFRDGEEWVGPQTV